MKKVLCLIALFFLLSSFSFHEYLAKVEDKDSWIKISVRTFENKNSICRLIIDYLEIIPPEDSEEGYLIMDLIRDPDGRCLMAFGPHKGQFWFEKHMQLPLGTYHLIINGEEYGFLNIQSKESFLNGLHTT